MVRIFRHYYSMVALVLFLVEACGASIAVCAAYYYFLARSDLGHAGELATILTQVLLLALAMYAMGVYERPHSHTLVWVLQRLAVCLLISVPILAVITQQLSGQRFESDNQRWIIYFAIAGAIVASVVSSRLIYSGVARAIVAPHRILVVGAGKFASEIEKSVRSWGASNDVIVGYYNLTNEKPAIDRAKVVATSLSLSEVIQKTGAKELVVALDDRRGVPTRELLEARMAGIGVTSYLSFWEREARRINLGNLEPSWLIYSDGFRSNGILKRLFDICCSAVLLTIALPILAGAACAIRLSGQGSVLYSQERVGRQGKSFEIYKLRTMRDDAENGQPQWATTRDPRITRVGSFLRLTRIDELPQLWNVLKGDMSLVGPRPERPYFVENLAREIPYYTERHRVRPGITGWAQINYPYGASIEDARQKLAYDLYYIKNYSLLLDLSILLATVQTVLWSKGAR